MRRARGCLARVLLLSLLLVAIAWLPRLLAVPPSADPADLLFVFPGEVPQRARCAARRYRAGVAPLLLFSGGSVRPELAAVGRPLADAEVNRLISVQHGVPPAAACAIPSGTSTWEDAGVLRAWLRSHPARRVLAVTSPSHSRRALWTLRVALADTGVDVGITYCRPPDGPLSGWWLRERALVRIFDEGVKLALYGLRYLLPAVLHLRAPPEAPQISCSPGS